MPYQYRIAFDNKIKTKGSATTYTRCDTTLDSVVLDRNGKPLENKIDELMLQVKQLQRYVTPRKLEMNTYNNNFYCSHLNCYRVGDFIHIIGKVRNAVGVTLQNGATYPILDFPAGITDENPYLRVSAGTGFGAILYVTNGGRTLSAVITNFEDGAYFGIDLTVRCKTKNSTLFHSAEDN